MKQAIKWFCAVLLLCAFVALAYATTHVDVRPIGPKSTQVGLSALNEKIFELCGVEKNENGTVLNDRFYQLTEMLGYASIVVCAGFGVLGLLQLISRRSLKRVDRTIYCLAGLYIITIVLYVVFNKLVINYRPLIMAGETMPEASFPSSHSMLVMVVMGSTVMVLHEYVANTPVRVMLRIICILVLLAMVGLRLLSGVHWPTDIAAGCVLGGMLLFLFSAVWNGSEKN